MTPLYPHDCDNCQLIRQDQLRKGTPVDVYVCAHVSLHEEGSVLIRFGPGASEYWSMPIAVLRSVRTRGSTCLQLAKEVVLGLQGSAHQSKV